MDPIFGPKMSLFLGYHGNGEFLFLKFSFLAYPDTRLTFDMNIFIQKWGPHLFKVGFIQKQFSAYIVFIFNDYTFPNTN